MKAKDKDFLINRKFVQSTTFYIGIHLPYRGNERSRAQNFRST